MLNFSKKGLEVDFFHILTIKHRKKIIIQDFFTNLTQRYPWICGEIGTKLLIKISFSVIF